MTIRLRQRDRKKIDRQREKWVDRHIVGARQSERA